MSFPFFYFLMSYLDTYLRKGEVFYLIIRPKEGFCLSEPLLDITTDILYDMNEKGYFLLFGFSVLPWEIHLVIRPDKVRDLDKIAKGIKRRISRKVENLTLPIWKKEIEIQIVRSRTELLSILSKIHNIPLEKGLVKDERKYRYSSSYSANVTDLDTLW